VNSYRRAGLEACHQLANSDGRIAAPELIETVDELRILVTRRVAGCAVGAIVTAGCRWDKNPFRKRDRIDRCRLAIDAVLHFLATLHKSPIPDCSTLWDHGPRGVYGRVMQHLQDLQPLANGTSEPVWQFADPGIRTWKEVPVLGDATLGNFIFDGSRIACVDFEDFGVGEPERDYLVLSEELKRIQGRWHYWRIGDGIAVPASLAKSPWQELYLAEMELLRCKQAGRGRKAGRNVSDCIANTRAVLRAVNSKVLTMASCQGLEQERL